MREGIHPNYVESTVACACGASFKTRSTKPLIKLDICSSCHPFFTGRQKFVDTAGRVERFQKRFATTSGQTITKKAEAPKMAKGQKQGLTKAKIKVLSSAPAIKPKTASTTGKGASKAPAAAKAPAAPAKPH